MHRHKVKFLSSEFSTNSCNIWGPLVRLIILFLFLFSKRAGTLLLKNTVIGLINGLIYHTDLCSFISTY